MPNYSNIQKEETLKSLVHEDYFSKFGYEPNIDNIDFVTTDKKARNDLFSEGPEIRYTGFTVSQAGRFRAGYTERPHGYIEN